MVDELWGEHPRADPTEIVSSIIIRPIGGVAPSERELPVPPLCGVPTERNPSTHPYPGLHPGLVCSAPLGHPIESSMALPRLVEALLSAAWGQAVCAGWAGFGDRLLGGKGCWEDAKCLRNRLLGIGRLFVEIISAGTRCSPEIALCGGRCGVASRGVGGWETAGPGLT